MPNVSLTPQDQSEYAATPQQRLAASAGPISLTWPSRFLSGMLLMALGALLAIPAHAATITVNSTADNVVNDGTCTLREAIRSANTDTSSGSASGECLAGNGTDTIQFSGAVVGSTITLVAVDDTTVGPSALLVNSAIIIQGGSATTITRGGSSKRLFYVDSTGNLSLFDVVLSNGRAQGFRGGTSLAGGRGGGSAGLGGAIFSEGAVSIERSTVSGSRAIGGAGGGPLGSGPDNSGAGGAGLWSAGGNGIDCDGMAINGGAGGPPLGGAGGVNAGDPGASGGFGGGGGGGACGSFGDGGDGGDGGRGGFGGGGGGGGESDGPDVDGGDGGDGGFGGGGGGGSLARGTGTPGRAGSGGLGAGDGGRGDGTGSFGEGSGGGGGAGIGGAVFVRFGTLTVTDSTFSDNEARGGAGGQPADGGVFGEPGLGVGGAVSAFGEGGSIATVMVTNSTFSGNRAAAGFGGAIFSQGAILTVSSSTFSGNEAPGDGTTTGGGGIAYVSTILTLDNSLLANNSGDDVVGSGGSSGEGNLIETHVGFLGGIVTTVDPALGPLADNGGPTFTHAIGQTSSALDAGVNAGAPSTDQRGGPRPVDGDGDSVATVDIGAFELQLVDVSIAKSDSIDPVVAGSPFSYTLTIENLSSSVATNVVVVDTLPALVNVVSLPSGCNESPAGTVTCTIPAVAANSSTQRTLNVVASAALAAGSINNTASVTTDSDDPVPGNDSDSETTTVVHQSDLAISKSDGVTSATPGETLTYTIVATNNGPSDNPIVTVTDNFPAELQCTFSSVAAGGASGNTGPGAGNLVDVINLPAGATVTYTVNCAIDPDATGTLVNTATIASSITDPVSSNNSATDSDTLLTPETDLEISKTDGVTSATPGETVTYTIVASNNGPSAEPAATLLDAFPAPLQCSYTSVASIGVTGNTASGSSDLNETLNLPVGGTVTYTVLCTIEPEETGTLSNTATIASSVTDPVPSNNSATDNDTVLVPQADLEVTKSDGVTSAAPGATVTYTIVARNLGPSDDPFVSLTDVLASNLECTYSSVAAGGASGNTAGAGDIGETLSLPRDGSVTYTVDCTIDSDATGVLSNTATVASALEDPVPSNDSATDDDTALVPVADVFVTKSDGVTSATPGATVTYTVEAGNNGPSDDPVVSLTDTLPADLQCDYTSIAAGGASGNSAIGAGDLSETLNLPSNSTVTYTLVCEIASSATGTLSNTVTISGSRPDPDASNDSAVDSNTVLTPQADLLIAKDNGVAAAVPDQALTYSLVVSNLGPSDAPLSTVTDAFPAGLGPITWTCTASAESSCAPSGSGDIVESVDLAAGGTVTFTAATSVTAGFVGPIVNSATVQPAPGVLDMGAANNTSSDTTVVTSSAIVVGVKSVQGDFLPDSLVTYRILLSNLSPHAQLDNPGDELIDVLPPELTALSAFADVGIAEVDPSGDTARWNGSIPGNGMVEIVIEAELSSGIAGILVTNQATILVDADGDGTNELSVLTDDESVTGDQDPTTFMIRSIVEVPTLGTWATTWLALVLAMCGLVALRRAT